MLEHRGLRFAHPRLLTRSPPGNKTSLEQTCIGLQHRGLRFAYPRLLTRSPPGNKTFLEQRPSASNTGGCASLTPGY